MVIRWRDCSYRTCCEAQLNVKGVSLEAPVARKRPSTDAELLGAIAHAAGLSHAGHHDEARRLLEALWNDSEPNPSALVRIAIAHAMGDVASTPDEQVVWDERALVAAELLTEAELRAAGIECSRAEFFPSLHLNLGDAHCRAGQLELARRHCALGQTALRYLAIDGYLEQVAEGLKRLEVRIRSEFPRMS